ncbi:MAG TPA: hypothetical protein VHE30_18370 [Polyangiaceae bacterium]|nr:hypothetical protein [Polyangiaceae bacterium]
MSSARFAIVGFVAVCAGGCDSILGVGEKGFDSSGGGADAGDGERDAGAGSNGAGGQHGGNGGASSGGRGLGDGAAPSGGGSGAAGGTPLGGSGETGAGGHDGPDGGAGSVGTGGSVWDAGEDAWFGTGGSSGRAGGSDGGSTVPVVHIDEFDIPTAGARATGIAAGRDGAVWFTEEARQRIGRITIAGEITEFGPIGVSSYPIQIASGVRFHEGDGSIDGELWFADLGQPMGSGETKIASIGRIATSGDVTEWSLPAGYIPQDVAVVPDGTIWFTTTVGAVGSMNPNSHAVSWLSGLPAGAGSIGITAGPDGYAWYVAQWPDRIGSTDGAHYQVPTQPAGVVEIVAGPDGALWFTEFTAGKIGRVTVDGQFTEFGVEDTQAQCVGITVGPDGALWFTRGGTSEIGRITVDGFETHYPIPTQHSAPNLITLGSDGNLWFTEANTNKIGRVHIE